MVTRSGATGAAFGVGVSACERHRCILPLCARAAPCVNQSELQNAGTKAEAPRSYAQVVAENADYCLATWHQTVITLWVGPPTVDQVLRISAACKLMLANSSKGPASYLSVIERSSPAPSEPVRKEFANWSRDVVSRLGVAVMVAEGGGFRGALVRGVGVALTVLLPHKVPFKFASSVEEGCEMLRRELPPGVTPADASAAIGELRQRWAKRA